jgi:phosphate transport system substrate-binding protein
VALILPCIGFAIAVVAVLSGAASANTLRIGGAGAATGFLPELFAPFERSDATKLTLIPSLGSGGGLRALEDGVLDVAVSGRTLKPEELKLGLTQALSIRTPFGLVTSLARPNGLKSKDIADIFKSQNAAWADGTPIRIILRPKSDSDTPILGGMFPGMAAAIEDVRRRPDIPVAATDQDNASLAERVTGSLAGSSFTQIKTERRALRFVAIDGVEPSLEDFQTGVYPYGRPLFFVLPARKAPAAERFIAYLRSGAGQAALHATGNLLMID